MYKRLIISRFKVLKGRTFSIKSGLYKINKKSKDYRKVETNVYLKLSQMIFQLAIPAFFGFYSFTNIF